MAQVEIEEVVDHLSTEFRKALEDICREHFPSSDFDSQELFRDFLRAVRRRCSTWEEVPNEHVKMK